MAKKDKKELPLEERIYNSCNKLRGTIEPSEYKHVVLGLIFLKFANDKFEERKIEIINEGNEKYIEMEPFYTQNNVFYLDTISRWSHIVENSKQDDIALIIDTAFSNIERNNKSLRGALPKNYFSRLNLEKTKLASLLDTINGVDTLIDQEQDVIGRVYEYFLQRFAISESSGKGKGEFYTPKSTVNLIAELIEPYKGIIYDPCCGTGGMFVQSLKFINKHQGNQKEVSVYGQENTDTTYKLAKMNLAIRGIKANLGDERADTFSNDQFKDLKADFIIANPPFNLKDWRGENELLDDPRWQGYAVPPVSNANYGWILHMVSKLSENGIAGFILANGALGSDGDEYKIRKKLIENDLIESIIIIPRDTFYHTDISVTLWIVNKNKKQRASSINKDSKQYRNRSGEILFMDLRRWGSEFDKKYIELTKNEIKKVALNLHNWQQSDFKSTYKDIPEYCYSAGFEELKANNFSLVPSKYIEFIDQDNEIDFDSEMQRIQENFKELLREERASQEQLINAFKVLGYEV